MFQRTKLCTSLLVAFGGLAALPSHAQDAATTPDAAVQRVEITGSAISRINMEGSLPVVVLKKADIEKTGATSTVDLLQRLSTVQGGTPEAGSVGGTTYGFSGVSIHDIGETRTLVLLNGHRLSQFGGQTLTGFAAGFDLNAIPIQAIDRVEVLTDGASALYGADAIAGVVNFITKRDFRGGNVSGGGSWTKKGASENRASLSLGFGDMDADGYNVSFTYGHDRRASLRGADRSFSKTGNLVFQQGGNTYRSQNYSASSIPANILNTNDPDPNNWTLINPYLIANGSCAPNSFRVTDVYGDDFCGFDYVSQLEIYPERTRDSGFATFNKRLGSHELFADVLLSSTSQTSRIAQVPGAIAIDAGTPLWQQYVAPLGITGDTLAYYRVADLGARTNNDKADFLDVALGSKGTFGSVDYTATYTHSQSTVRGGIEGYPGALALKRLTNSGDLNPFLLPGQQSAAGQAGLAAANYKGYFDGGVAKLDSLQLQGSSPIAHLGAGDVSLAAGLNVNKEKFQSSPSLFAQGLLADPVAGTLCDPAAGIACDQRFGDAAAEIPYSANRTSWGAFSEINVPIVKGLDVTGDIRYDHFSDFGSATTFKGSFRFAPVKSVLFRGSVGTGFHAPSVPQVSAAPQSYGVTEDPYSCTPELQQVADQLGAQCQPGKRQYDVIAGGNPNLKAERSRQATFGMRLEPAKSFTFGVDWWWVNIRDAFGQLSESTVFANPLQYYPGAWTTQTDIATGVKYLAWNAGNLNLGKSYTSGLDFDTSFRSDLGFGKLNSQVTATHLLRSRTQDPGDGSLSTDLGDNSSGALAFRWKGAWRTTLATGPISNTLGINFQSGYWDAPTSVEQLDASGTVINPDATVRIHVKPYYTADWQTSWDITKNINLTGGILNLTNKKPPFVLNTTGGQQVGYDGNLYDPRGRTFYVNGTIHF